MTCLPLLAVLPGLLLVSCGDKPTSLNDLNTQSVTLPNGTTIRAEVMIRSEDMMRGMMFRDALPPDRGMLFIYAKTGKYSHWMYQVRVPLDIIWMDSNKRIVEMSLDTPPCPSASARECPNYGGNENAQFVLELAGGVGRKHNLRAGDMLSF